MIKQYKGSIHKNSIRKRLTRRMIGLAIIPLFITGFLLSWQNYRNQAKHVLQLEQEVAKRVAREVELFIDTMVHDLQAALKMGVSPSAPLTRIDYILTTLQTYHHSFEALFLIDENGDEINKVSRAEIITSRELKNYSSVPLFLEPKRTGTIYYSPVTIQEDLAIPVMTIAVPIFDKRTNTFKAVLAGEIRFRKIWDYFGDIALNDGAQVYIVGMDNKLIAHNKPMLVLNGKTYELPESDGVNTGLNGDRVIMAIRKVILGSQVLYIVAERNQVDAMAYATNTLIFIIVLLLTVFFIAVSTGVSVVGKILRPIQALVDFTRSIEPDKLDTRAIITGDDEISDLALAFNTMIDSLKQSMVSLEVLEKSQRRFRDIAENTGDWIWEVDDRGMFIYSNSVIDHILGYTREEILGCFYFDIVFREDKKKIRGELKEILDHSKVYKNMIVPLQKKDGTRVVIESSGVPVFEKDGTIKGYRGVNRDITDRMKAEESLKLFTEQLKTSNTELEEFAYIASHDLQEPLRKIVFFGDRLKSKLNNCLDEKAVDYLNRMLTAANRMEMLIKGLLLYSRVSTSGSKFIHTDLNEIIHEVLSDLEIRIEETHGQVMVGQLPLLRVDPLQMRQLFQNIIGNALKYRRTGVNPVVKITSRKVEDHSVIENGDVFPAIYEIIISDNGIGFDMKNADKIFGVFQRLVGRSHYEGTGIGLAICKKIVGRHSGDIHVSSVKGEGTTFAVLLPLIDVDDM